MSAGKWVLDSTKVMYYWENSYYPQYLVPVADIDMDTMPNGALTTVDEIGADQRLVAWGAVDRWFEEDEEVFVHPRSPYARADAVRSTRHVRVELDGIVLAETSGCVIVFETGLPPRYYLDKGGIDWALLRPSETVSACPYKGITSGYWDVVLDGETTTDIAWAYDFPTVAISPIAGLVAFYDTKVSVIVD